jgi:hypothetical protein
VHVAELREVPDGLRLVLARDEVELLSSLASSLIVRLESDGGGPDEDPVIGRFTPTASRNDDAADRELRGMLAGDLLDQRRSRLGALVADLETWADSTGIVRVLDVDAAIRLIETLNDLRLALGASIDVEALDRDSLPEGDPRTMTLQLMDHLGWMQGRLIDFIDP